MSEPITIVTGLGHHVDSLVPLVYDELRASAAKQLRAERVEHTLQPTALVHEAFMRLDRPNGARWKDATEFKAVAAHVMRQVLCDHARRRNAIKRGGGRLRLTFDEQDMPAQAVGIDLLALDKVLADLKELDGRQYQVVMLRYFGGLKNKDVAAVLGVGKSTIDSDWTFVRTWVHQRLGEGVTQS